MDETYHSLHRRTGRAQHDDQIHEPRLGPAAGQFLGQYLTFVVRQTLDAVPFHGFLSNACPQLERPDVLLVAEEVLERIFAAAGTQRGVGLEGERVGELGVLVLAHLVRRAKAPRADGLVAPAGLGIDVGVLAG